MGPVNIFVAFFGGILSFFSPCIFPLIPGFVGLWLGSIPDESSKTKRLILSTILFVAGFGIVFTFLGLFAGTAGVVLRGKIIRIIFGIIIIIFGLHLSELLQLPLLDIENRPFLRRKTISPLQSFLMGLGFAFGWSPCIGPILASILLVASQTRNTINGAILLFSFSLGVGLPFILIGVFSSFFLKYIRKLNRYLPLVQLISGKFLAFIGLALLTGYLEKLSGISQLTSKQLLALLIILFLIYLEIKLLLSTYKKVMGKLEEEFLPRWVSQLFFLDFFLFAGLLFAGKLIGI